MGKTTLMSCAGDCPHQVILGQMVIEHELPAPGRKLSVRPQVRAGDTAYSVNLLSLFGQATDLHEYLPPYIEIDSEGRAIACNPFDLDLDEHRLLSVVSFDVQETDLDGENAVVRDGFWGLFVDGRLASAESASANGKVWHGNKAVYRLRDTEEPRFGISDLFSYHDDPLVRATRCQYSSSLIDIFGKAEDACRRALFGQMDLEALVAGTAAEFVVRHGAIASFMALIRQDFYVMYPDSPPINDDTRLGLAWMATTKWGLAE